MTVGPRPTSLHAVPHFLVHHRHDAADCGVVFTSFRGQQSPLRRRTTLASCPEGGHEIWWAIQAADEQDALSQLPYFVACRSTVTRVSPVHIP